MFGSMTKLYASFFQRNNKKEGKANRAESEANTPEQNINSSSSMIDILRNPEIEEWMHSLSIKEYNNKLSYKNEYKKDIGGGRELMVFIVYSGEHGKWNPNETE